MKRNIGILAAAYSCLVDTLSLWRLDNDGVRAVFIFFGLSLITVEPTQTYSTQTVDLNQYFEYS